MKKQNDFWEESMSKIPTNSSNSEKPNLYDVREDDVEKLAEQEFLIVDYKEIFDNDIFENHKNRQLYRQEGFIIGYKKAKEMLLSEKREIESLKRESYRKGYNKAKENTYTEEQVREAMYQASLMSKQIGSRIMIDFHDITEYIKSLKQHKQ